MMLPDRPHHVYRLYDEADELLYIGCTHNIEQRLRGHQSLGARSVLFAHRIARVESVEYPTQAEALAAERTAIADEYPTFNVIHRRWGSPELTQQLRDMWAWTPPTRLASAAERAMPPIRPELET